MAMINHRWFGWITCILALAALIGKSALAQGQQPDKRIKRDYGFYEPEPLDFNEHQGYAQIFDGVTLKNWDGDPNTWAWAY